MPNLIGPDIPKSRVIRSSSSEYTSIPNLVRLVYIRFVPDYADCTRILSWALRNVYKADMNFVLEIVYNQHGSKINVALFLENKGNMCDSCRIFA